MKLRLRSPLERAPESRKVGREGTGASRKLVGDGSCRCAWMDEMVDSTDESTKENAESLKTRRILLNGQEQLSAPER